MLVVDIVLVTHVLRLLNRLNIVANRGVDFTHQGAYISIAAYGSHSKRYIHLLLGRMVGGDVLSTGREWMLSIFVSLVSAAMRGNLAFTCVF